jgi:phosphatidylglycerol:prolipoprotein diacylglycerol transferase
MCERSLELFGYPLPVYSTMLVLGFALATWIGVRWAKRVGVDHEAVIDLGLYALIWGVIGGRILHVVADGFFWDYVNLCLDPSQVSWNITRAECAQAEGVWDAGEGVCRPSGRDCFAWAAFWNGGLAYYGGLAVAAVYCMWFLHKEKLPSWRVADMAGMTVPLGLFFGRLGCFLGGCCFGKVSDHAFALRFPAWSPASRKQWQEGLLDHPSHVSLAVHPTQLYEALGCLLIAAGMMLWLHPRKRFDGQVFLAFLGSYALLRFILEYLRADDRGGLLGLSTSQLIGVLIIAAAAYLWLRLKDEAAEALRARSAA